MRRYGEPKIPGIEYVTRPGAYGVLIRGEDVLLTHQAKPFSETQLPGGGIDPGETAIQALHREVIEETGWRIEVFRRLGAYQRYTYMPDYDIWARKVCHIYLCRPSRQICEPIEPHHSSIWVHRDDAAHMLSNAGDADFVRQLLRRF
ncbi:NUDIX hydrolase [Amylibacter ulvae]|uniref:NUDIX hydrolase n=1 Tax=Paramylibacter ulvae TaxID=1651968 RepID=A0ABQ3CXX5_9RHOB|nr:NUDIX hydrolase [Amylibacter ulvae]GHA49164.1 NUDIX hydrolase [Amylibacter ulvae]